MTLGNSSIVELDPGDNDDLVVSSQGNLLADPDASGSRVTGIESEGWYSWGDIVVVENMSTTATVTLVDNGSGTGSEEDNRMHLPNDQDVILRPGDSYSVKLDFTLGAWKSLAGPPTGLGNIISTSTVSRSFGTAFQVSTTRVALVYYSVQVSSDITLSGGDDGNIELRCDASNPPTTVRGIVGNGNTGTVVVGIAQTDRDAGQLHYALPVGHRCVLVCVTLTGTPTCTYLNGTEQLI